MPYQKGRKCSSCSKPIGDYSKTGFCVRCWHEYNKGENAMNWRGGLEGRLLRELERNQTHTNIFNNKAERLFYGMMIKQGWKASKRGWPDFICFKDDGDEFMVVEVKSNADQEAEPVQQFILEALAKRGVDTYLWNPQTGFSRITN